MQSGWGGRRGGGTLGLGKQGKKSERSQGVGRETTVPWCEGWMKMGTDKWGRKAEHT